MGTFTIGGLIGTLFGSFIGHALAIRRGKLQIKHVASVKFKKALLPAILSIDDGNNPITVISNSFSNHNNAALEFYATLKGHSASSFNKDYLCYKKWCEVMCGRDQSEILYGENEPEYIKMKEIDPRCLVNNLLKHANI